MEHRVLDEAEWQEARSRHERRLSSWAERERRRRSHGRPDPVTDFLLEYYGVRPAQLLRWSPGLGIVLRGESAESLADRPGFVRDQVGVRVDEAAFPRHRRPFLHWLRELCVALERRPPFFGCAGMHEWAMLYRSARPRHAQLPLRISSAELEATLERLGLACTHFDASRFFTPAARPLLRAPLARERMIEVEQRGCLHANMDLFRWAKKLFPWSSGELVGDTFLLACEIREVDMRASPYDLSAFGLEPIRVETERGRQRYRELQAGFAEAAGPLRRRLLLTVERLLAAEEVADRAPGALP